MSRIGFRHCDSRFPFIRNDSAQPAARWHAAGAGPANYFADTPVGAWAEFLRHEGITDPLDLVGVARSLWAVELPDTGYASPGIPAAVMLGDLTSYGACQAEAGRLRATAAERIEAPSAALLPGCARGWIASPHEQDAPIARDGRVWVLYGSAGALIGSPAVEAGAPPARVLPLVRQF